MAGSPGVVLDVESDTLSPLPTFLYRGLTGVTVIASISLFSTATLFLHLTYKLIRLEIKERRKVRRAAAVPPVDLSLGLSERHFATMGHRPTREPTPTRQAIKAKPNQFVILIYNLLLADMHQAMAFFLNAAWISKNEISVGTGPCWVQGWYVSTGDLASSCFIMAIAIHTYLTVIRQYKPPQWAINTAVVGIWIFVYVMSMLGIALTRNGKAAGGWFVRAAAWCWINVKYENYRLLTHYLFIFIALAVTSGIYTLIFFTLRSRTAKEEEAARLNSERRSNHHKASMEDREPAPSTHTPAVKQGSGHHPGFFVYPVIYVICTLPLALGRIATMAGADVSQSYFCAAAALIVSNGWLDVLLWGSTRRTLIFGEIDKEDALGLETFTFMRTPHGRRYGNMVWVQGASDGEVLPGGAGDRNTSWWNRLGLGGRQARVHERQLRHGGHRRTGERSISQESLRGAGRNNDMGMAIQMDTVTTVVVEVEPDAKSSSRGRETSTHSLNGSEKEVSHRV